MPEIQQDGHGRISCKLVCGADVLETFNTPGLWADEDVSYCFCIKGKLFCAEQLGYYLYLHYNQDSCIEYT